MNDRTYVYAIHIGTTAEALWKALTSDEFVRQYFPDFRLESEWKVGSPVKYFTREGEFFSEGEILESNPPRKLAYTWPEPAGQRSQALPERLLWEISDSGPGTVLLKLIHDRLTEENHQSVSQGWPVVLSSLKTLLERGTPLAFHPRT